MLVRLSKRQAKYRFFQGEPIVLCPCKFVPHGPFSMGLTVHAKEYLEKAAWYRDHQDKHFSAVWKGSVEETAWAIMYNNWSYYNTSHETGYYAHYYREDSNAGN